MNVEDLPTTIPITQTVTTEQERFVPLMGSADLHQRVVETIESERSVGTLSRTNWSQDESMCGWTFYHDGCAVALAFDSPHLPRGWPAVTITESEPLTIAEEIACPKCGMRGRISNGHWVPTAPEPDAGPDEG